MDEGFILSNKFRRAIFAELVSGETNIERIAKKQHIIRNVRTNCKKTTHYS